MRFHMTLLMVGRKFKGYRAEKDHFTLYSIGWNEKDDGGVVVQTKEGYADLVNGDWAWPYRERLN